MGVTQSAHKAFCKHFVMCGVQGKKIQNALREQGDKMNCNTTAVTCHLERTDGVRKNSDTLLMFL